MEHRPRILVIEDEAPILRGLCDVLTFHGYTVHGIDNGPEGLASASPGGWDLLLVDVMLPGLDGFTLCRQIRERHPTQAILLLTARGSEDDILEGFGAGADDYVTKPFSVAQLLARIEALLRRSGGAPRPTFQLGPVTIEVETLVAVLEGATVELSRRDVALLAYLTDRPGCPVSREELLREVWGYRCVSRVETRCVDMHVSKLRRRLALLTDDELVQTVRGAGYRAGGPG
ncbi:MAG TPA: response regulator transcription factor [Deltaproteobacteria bacterium]|nr:response regulator transcription factor [Deltaproteobacteria bacterium]